MPKTSVEGRVPEEGVVTLCGVQGCCPTVDFTNPDRVILRDDYNGQVQLTPQEWRELTVKFGGQPAVEPAS